MIKVMHFLLILTSLGAGSALAGEKMSLETHQLLIQKLERVLENLEEGDLSKSNLALRLADLYAEKARLLDMADGAMGTQAQRASASQSRRKAIELYKTHVQKTSRQKRGEIYLLTAHLHELLGDDKSADLIYEAMVRNSKAQSPETLSKAQTARADLFFRKGQFEKAKQLFEAAFANKTAPRRGYVLFRLAWCDYHMGRYLRAKSSMIQLLRSPDLMRKKSDGALDSALQEEASRDLTTFISRAGLQTTDVALLSEVSPGNVKIANLTYLATELDRTGRKKEALAVWGTLGQSHQTGSEKLEGQIRIAQIQYDLGKKKETVTEISKALELWKEEDCEDSADCQALRQQLRKIITDWGKAEEREPSPQLIQAYTLYIQTIPDLEMNYWAGNAARKLKQYVEASRFYNQAADLAAVALKTSSRASSPQRLAQIFEGALLSEIEVAELSGNLDLKDIAYAHYLKLNPEGPQAQKVHYQVAQTLSERKRYADAATAFKEIALSPTSSAENLREKAADLALDNLVLAKDDERLESWAIEFSRTFKGRSADFQRIARQSALNQAAQAYNDPETRGELKLHLEKLSALDLTGAKVEERINVLKHILLLAHHLKDLSQIDRASALLLKFPQISPKERDNALENRAWVAELRLQFEDALIYQRQIKNSKLSTDDRTMKLATLSELAGKDPSEYYELYLKIGKLQSQRQWSAYQLVMLSKNKVKAFKKYASAMKANSALYRKAALVTFQRSGDLSVISPIPQDLSPEGRFFSQLVFLENFAPVEKEVARQRLNGESQKALRSSLQRQLNTITKLEGWANKAIDAGLWTIQLKTLSSVASAYQKLAREIQDLPTPKGLRAAERLQYRKLLTAQALPYHRKVKEIQAEIDKLWSADENLKDLFLQASGSAPELAKAAQWELKIVTDLAKKTGHSSVLSKKKPRSDRNLHQHQVAEARERVMRDPFSLNSIETLRDIERLRGRESMVAYLDARILELKDRTLEPKERSRN